MESNSRAPAPEMMEKKKKLFVRRSAPFRLAINFFKLLIAVSDLWRIAVQYTHIVHVQSVNDRFFMFDEIETDAVISLDEDAQLTTDEVCYTLLNNICHCVYGSASNGEDRGFWLFVWLSVHPLFVKTYFVWYEISSLNGGISVKFYD